MASKQIKIGSNSGKLKKFIIASMKDKLHHTKGTAKELKRIESLINEHSVEMKNKKDTKAKDRKVSFFSSVPDRRLKSLAKNGRDYSKPTLNELIEEARRSNGKEKPKAWMKIVSVPMGGMNKK